MLITVYDSLMRISIENNENYKIYIYNGQQLDILQQYKFGGQMCNYSQSKTFKTNGLIFI